MPRLTADQHDERAKGVGASDVPVIAGVSPWGSAFELYLEKIGEFDPHALETDKDRAIMERGHRFEDLALQWHSDITNQPVIRVRRTVWHRDIPFLFCHPDAAYDRKLTRLLEVKTHPSAWKEVPRHVEVQVQAQMACTGAVSCDVLLQTFYGPPLVYTIERDQELIEAIQELVISFWRRVVDRDPPPVDGSPGARRWLDRTRWRDEPDIMADDLQRKRLARLIEVRDTIKDLEREDAEIVAALAFSMAGSTRLNAPGIGKATWSAPSDRRTTKWKEVSAEYRIEIEMAAQAHGDPLPEFDAIELRHTTIEEGVRTFRLTREKE